MSPIATSKTRRPFSIPSREDLVKKTRKRLLRRGLPRLQMFGLLVLTGATGFLSSFVLLKSGVDSMTLRYPVAVALAYGAFLLLLRIWLHLQREGGPEVTDVIDLGVDSLETVGSFGPDHGGLPASASAAPSGEKPSHGARVATLRPAWPSWIAAAAPLPRIKLVIRRQAFACASV